MVREFDPDVVWRDPATLTPYAHNAKTHPDDQVDRIAASIAEYGFDQPIVVDADGVIIKGHGRRLAALRLGLKTVPVIMRSDLSPAQVKAARLLDNKSAESEWDIDALVIDLQALKEEDFDGPLGFDEDEIASILAGTAETTGGLLGEDEIPEPPADTVTRPGDLWILGEHRLLCGDATIAADVERLLAGAKPHLMVTDPPYGVSYDPGWRNEAGVSTTSRTGKVANDDRADWREAWALFPGDVAYVWHAGIHAATVAESLEVCGFRIRAQIVWSKPRFALGRGDYQWQHEPIYYSVRKGGKSHWQGARDQSTIWAVGTNDEDAVTVHGTQKPVECMRRPMVNNSMPGDAVYEPFCGSGTTLVAAETTGRICFAMEIDPRYCDVIIERWNKLTGRNAWLEESEKAFVEISEARAAT